jgi:hypothetical protein
MRERDFFFAMFLPLKQFIENVGITQNPQFPQQLLSILIVSVNNDINLTTKENAMKNSNKLNSYKPMELNIFSTIFAYIFDKGMNEAISEGTQNEYLSEKICDALFDPRIKSVFKTINSEVQMDKVLWVLEHAQTRDINKAWLRFHNIHLEGIKLDGEKAMIFDQEVVFYLRHDQRVSGNKLIQPKTEHIASTCNMVEKTFTSIRRFKTIIPCKTMEAKKNAVLEAQMTS